MRVFQYSKLVLYVGALIAIEILLIQLGHSSLSLPWETSQSCIQWFKNTSYVTMLFAGGRLLAMVATAHLLIDISLIGLVCLTNQRRLAIVVEALSSPLTRRAAQRVLGVSLVASLSLPAFAGASSGSTGDPNSLPTMRRLNAGEPNPARTTPTIIATTPIATHTVTSGESLWSIAKAELIVQLDRSPSAAETSDYWLELIRKNRSLFADPNLIWPGLVLFLPNSAPE